MPNHAPPSDVEDRRPALAGRRVLVVDDDESIRSSAFNILAPYRCEVVAVRNGAEAIEVVTERGASGAFDAILAAVRLPDMTGANLMLKLQSLEMPVPMAMMCSFGYDYDAILVMARRSGLRFAIFKPFLPKQLLDAVERLAVPPPGADLRPRHSNRRVLVVDAEKAVCQSAVEMLLPEGYEVATAESGSDALAVIARRGASGAFDAILIALYLPDMTGKELMDKLRQLEVSAPLAMTQGFGYDHGHIMLKARRAGVRHAVHKPFRRENLLEVVAQLVSPPPGSASFAESASRRHG